MADVCKLHPCSIVDTTKYACTLKQSTALLMTLPSPFSPPKPSHTPEEWERLQLRLHKAERALDQVLSCIMLGRSGDMHAMSYPDSAWACGTNAWGVWCACRSASQWQHFRGRWNPSAQLRSGEPRCGCGVISAPSLTPSVWHSPAPVFNPCSKHSVRALAVSYWHMYTAYTCSPCGCDCVLHRRGRSCQP